MKVSKQSWPYRLVTWVRQEEWTGQNLCPFFWTFVLSIFLIPTRLLAILAARIDLRFFGGALFNDPASHSRRLEAMLDGWDPESYTAMNIRREYRWESIGDLVKLLGASVFFVGVPAMVLVLLGAMIVAAFAGDAGAIIMLCTLGTLATIFGGLVYVCNSEQVQSVFNLIFEFASASYNKVCPHLTIVD